MGRGGVGAELGGGLGERLCECTDLVSPPGGDRNLPAARGPARLKERTTGNNAKIFENFFEY